VNLQEPFDIAVIVPTMLRPSLGRAVRSVFAQDFQGRVQVLIGIDVKRGSEDVLQEIRTLCPANMAITVIDLGYSTSIAHGGVHTTRYGGAIRTILSYSANSRLLAYLDDDDWWDPSHLKTLREAIEGKSWAYSLRLFVDKATDKVLCKDEWDSVGVGKGINAPVGGFVAPSTLMLDKLKCVLVPALFSTAACRDHTGEDRLVFHALKDLPHSGTGLYTVYYPISEEDRKHAHHAPHFAARGVT
jgi:Glycosyl transferase family 2